MKAKGHTVTACQFCGLAVNRRWLRDTV